MASVKEKLIEVNSKIEEFKAQKLDALQADLDTTSKKASAAADDYKKQYEQLYARWCAQHQYVETLYQTMQSAFPGQEWREIVADCICKKLEAVSKSRKDIDDLEASFESANHKAWNEAKAAAEDAKASLDTLLANAQKIAVGLDGVDKLIKEVQTLVHGQEKAAALLPFWFELLPLHKDLCPEEGKVAEDCRKLGDDLTPEKLCPNGGSAIGIITKRPGAKLIDPQNYPNKLDDAWQKYWDTKKDAESKEAAYKKELDELDSLRKRLDVDAKKLEADITECLKKQKPKDKCSINAAAAGAPVPGGTPPAGGTSGTAQRIGGGSTTTSPGAGGASGTQSYGAS